MKFTIHMKTPDAVDYAIRDALPAPEDESDEEAYWNHEAEWEQVTELCSKWFKHGEAVSIEIDTEAKTATVIEA